MKFLKCFAVALMLVLCSFGQKTKAEEDLETLKEAIEDSKAVENVSSIIERVRSQNIQFDFGQREVALLLQAGVVGKRNPAEMAELILACLEVCEKCIARSFAPMTLQELKKHVVWKFSEKTIMQEISARGIKDLPMNSSGADQLRALGASTALIAKIIPDDKISAPAIPGYSALPLKRSEEFDSSAEYGWLKFAAKFAPQSKVEFVFKHTSLFSKPEAGNATLATAYFNKPSPRATMANLVESEFMVDPLLSPEVEGAKGGLARIGFAKKPKPVSNPILETQYLSEEKDGYNAFRVVVRNDTAVEKEIGIKIRWRVLDKPKDSPGAPLKSNPPK